MIYQNFHKHDYFSNIITPDSPVSPEAYAQRAVTLDHGIISSVNHGWCSRYIEYYELAQEYNLKFLFGTEAYIVKDRFEKDRTNAHIILLAKNENGRRKINKIISEANVTGFYYRARIDFDLLYSLPKDDVWITSACVSGIWKYEDADELVLQMFEHFGNSFFLEVQSHNTFAQKAINSKIINLANQNNIKIIFGCDSHFIYPDQDKDRDDYLLSKHIEYEDEVGWYMDYPNGEEVIYRFEKQNVLSKAQIKETIDNTNTFLDVEEYKSAVFSKNIKLPSIYPGKTQEEKNDLLWEIISKRWKEEKEKVPQQLWEKYVSEIQKEMDIVIETNMADYFLLDYEVIKRGKELGGNITLSGRGSAPSFYICKLLDFTTIDRISAPIKLFPERFMTKERILDAGSLPDIDFNIENQEMFAQAQVETLGEDHSYPMLSFDTMQPKAAWKMFSRARNINPNTANKISGQIGDYQKSLYYADDEDKDNIDLLDYIDNEYQDLVIESKKYLGIVATGKIHNCAFLLHSGNISEEIGLIKIKENLCCIMDGLWAETYSFLKNDLLKVAIVGIIYGTYDRINVAPHEFADLIDICKNDDKVWEIYKNAWTMGINQFEQPNTSGRAAAYAPQNPAELSAFVAAIRPGFQSNYRQFEAREPFSYGIPSLDSLIQTPQFPHSYLLYQENVMQVLEYAGIPTSETYDVVKNIAKKRVGKVLKYEKEFILGITRKIMQSESMEESDAHQIALMTWQIVHDNSAYGFNASHSLSVAGDSLYGAYLKSNYTLEFYEVFLKVLEKAGHKKRLTRAKQEAIEAYGIKFPPFRFRQDNRDIVANKEKNEITSSLGSIKGFRHVMGEGLYELGLLKHNTFVDFLIATEELGKTSKKFYDLIKINYFECFGGNKKLFMFYKEFLEGKSRYSRKYKEKTKNKRIEALYKIWEEIPDEKFSITAQIEFDRDILGYVQSIFPNIDKRFIFVLSLQTKFSPRLQAYCLNNGNQGSIKIQKALYDRNVFLGGDILWVGSYKKKPVVRFEDGKFIKDESGKTEWWIDTCSVVEPEEFDRIVNE